MTAPPPLEVASYATPASEGPRGGPTSPRKKAEPLSDVRPLSQFLQKRPLLFEAVPPVRRATPRTVEGLLSKIVPSLRRLHRLSAINVPEVLDENHMGQPFYRNLDPRHFGHLLREQVARDVVVNKVVVHASSRGAFVRWARDTIIRQHFHNVVLVGGASSLRKYPGPGVVEAAGMISHIYRSMAVHEGLVGSIAIPSRPHEAERLFTKTLSGVRFATTQILFDTDSLKGLLTEYDRLCREFEVDPLTVVISLAPVSDIHDLEFVRWLGAEVPDVVEESLFSKDPEAAKEHSIEIAVKVWKDTAQFARKRGIRVPLGLNVEQVSQHNLDAAIEMAEQLARELD
ncbi:MAG: methylenetetrahydrofolate reductase [Euryarchaeota archaeon]|nr:methylenetetrahydrofolate reductase [Euryarchaeota archaeon]MDE1837780.1 methylenetetrahydrofolate reductase [Euryarchaeota archaeon]MDE2046622.1 methylenetetrahydrofolate reductase [Thermoplasmata archaeon]